LSEIQKIRTEKQQAVFAAARHKAHEQAALRTGRYAEMGRKGGAILFEKKLGLFARTPEKITEDSQRGGKIAGQMAVENGHLSAAGSIGGKIRGPVQGKINASNGHLDYARHVRHHIKDTKKPKKYCRFCNPPKPVAI
jgi:hypothetical protein